MGRPFGTSRRGAIFHTSQQVEDFEKISVDSQHNRQLPPLHRLPSVNAGVQIFSNKQSSEYCASVPSALATLPNSFCQHGFLNSVASNSSYRWDYGRGLGFRQRYSPIGGNAYGTPANRTDLFENFRPFTLPFEPKERVVGAVSYDMVLPMVVCLGWVSDSGYRTASSVYRFQEMLSVF